MINFASRTIWAGDNLDILRGMNSESVDLCYLDPPFNSNRNYAAPPVPELVHEPKKIAHFRHKHDTLALPPAS